MSWKINEAFPVEILFTQSFRIYFLSFPNFPHKLPPKLPRPLNILKIEQNLNLSWDEKQKNMELSSKTYEKFKNGKLIPCFCAFRFENLIWDFYFNLILLQGFRLNLENKKIPSEMKNGLALN